MSSVLYRALFFSLEKKFSRCSFLAHKIIHFLEIFCYRFC